jgi:hypothetical protein
MGLILELGEEQIELQADPIAPIFEGIPADAKTL